MVRVRKLLSHLVSQLSLQPPNTGNPSATTDVTKWLELLIYNQVRSIVGLMNLLFLTTALTSICSPWIPSSLWA